MVEKTCAGRVEVEDGVEGIHGDVRKENRKKREGKTHISEFCLLKKSVR